MDIVALILLLGVIVFTLKRSRFFLLPGFSPNISLFLFGVRILAGLAVYWIYTYYYTNPAEADVHKFVHDGQILANVFYENPSLFFKIMGGYVSSPEAQDVLNKMFSWKTDFPQSTWNDATVMIRLNALTGLFSGGSVHFHFLIFNFFAFTGLVALYKTFYSPGIQRYFFLAAVFLLPSVLFWTSAPLKESVITGAFGILLLSIKYLSLKKKMALSLTGIIIGFGILSFLKIYILFALAVSSIAWVFVSKKFYVFRLAGSLVCLLILTWVVSMISEKMNVFRILSEKQAHAISVARGGVVLAREGACVLIGEENRKDLIEIEPGKFMIRRGSSYLKWGEIMADTIRVSNSADTSTWYVFRDFKRAGSYIEIPRMSPDLKGFLVAAPVGLLTSIRPFPWEAQNPLMIMPMLEMMILLGFIFLMIRKIKPGRNFYFLILFAVLILILTGITTPVLGNIVRYRMPAMLSIAVGLAVSVKRRKRD